MLGDSIVDAGFALNSEIPFYAVDDVIGHYRHRNFLQAVDLAIKDLEYAK
jgi:hypothetical protein